MKDELLEKRWTQKKDATEHKPIDLVRRVEQLLEENPDLFDHCTFVGHKVQEDGKTSITYFCAGTNNTSTLIGDLERAKLLMVGLLA